MIIQSSLKEGTAFITLKRKHMVLMFIDVIVKQERKKVFSKYEKETH